MAQPLKLEVVTPTKVLLSTEAEYITVPGIDGELGILDSHIPLLTTLRSGVLSYVAEGTTKLLAVHLGYAEVLDDTVTVLADQAEFAEDIDLDRAKEAQKTAEAGLADTFNADDEDQKRFQELQNKLARSITRQQIVK